MNECRVPRGKTSSKLQHELQLNRKQDRCSLRSNSSSKERALKVFVIASMTQVAAEEFPSFTYITDSSRNSSFLGKGRVPSIDILSLSFLSEDLPGFGEQKDLMRIFRVEGRTPSWRDDFLRMSSDNFGLQQTHPIRRSSESEAHQGRAG